MRKAGLEEAKAGIKIARRNISNLRYVDGTTLFQKTKIMASCPISSCHIDWEAIEPVTDFIFLGSKITADDCSH